MFDAYRAQRLIEDIGRSVLALDAILTAQQDQLRDTEDVDLEHLRETVSHLARVQAETLHMLGSLTATFVEFLEDEHEAERLGLRPLPHGKTRRAE